MVSRREDDSRNRKIAWSQSLSWWLSLEERGGADKSHCHESLPTNPTHDHDQNASPLVGRLLLVLHTSLLFPLPSGMTE
jgi:hypothetical protein